MEVVYLKISFIGAGKVGFSLGKYFSVNNLNVKGYYSKSFKSSKEAAKFTNSTAYEDIKEIVNDSDILFITTPDDVIFNIWQQISKLNLKNKIICHTSGSLSSRIFSNANNSGAYVYSVHPMFPFSDKLNSYKKLKQAYFSIEGDKTHIEDLKNLLECLGNKVVVINGEKKHLYHLANVTVSNLALALLNLGCKYMENCGVSSEDSLKALFPLIESNIMNIKERGFLKSITGPIERGDIGTVMSHLEVIPDEDKPLYKNLSLVLLQIAREKHSEKDYSKLNEILGGI
ncbi:prephenate dehydrogenase [Clostridium acetireducens DSM 10703]|uniref:Prephenate dehydrogenase n=1 Tax=Clostridium acetireducens DSM 10703 TaxID=1121290 RepID=A0A1E8EZZ2_9CLOT|nr:prephenate dehydrogenase [Clostridium acetireducens DSM 10703]